MQPVQIGDQIIVYGILPPAIVKDIVQDLTTLTVKIILDWGERGTSYVMLHDQNNIWYLLKESN